MRMTYSGVWFGLIIVTYVHKPGPPPHAIFSDNLVLFAHLRGNWLALESIHNSYVRCLQ